MSNKLTIVLVINELSKYFDVTIDSILSQSCKDFDIIIVDKYKKVNWDDVKIVSNENFAINICKTDYIYFMTDKDYLNTRFVAYFYDIQRKHPSKMYQFNFDNAFISDFNRYVDKLDGNLSLNHNIENKVFDVQFIKQNYLSFNQLKSMFNMHYIIFNYMAFSLCNNYYISNKPCCTHYGRIVTKRDYTAFYKELKLCIDQIKRYHSINKLKLHNDLNSYMKYEDNKTDLLLEFLNDKSINKK